jgi:hypothetical protein
MTDKQPNRTSHLVVPGISMSISISIAIAMAGLHGCKSTGRRSQAEVMQAKTYPSTQMEFPTLATLSAARIRGLAAVSNSGGKEPTLVYINIYPSDDAACAKHTTVELGISYDTGNKNDQSRAAGFYLKADPANGCAGKDELVMDASRALNAFLGMRPLDEMGSLETSVKIGPSDFLKKSAATIKFEESKAWNVFLKTMLGPVTLDSVQYQVEMLCSDDSVASALFMATDGSRIQTDDGVETGSLCAIKNRNEK